MYSPQNCHPQPSFVEHGHCGCQPGYLDSHYHYTHHQQSQPRPVAVVAHPPPLLLRPIQPQHIQQHQVRSQFYIFSNNVYCDELLLNI
jgi:hypothetical protein